MKRKFLLLFLFSAIVSAPSLEAMELLAKAKALFGLSKKQDLAKKTEPAKPVEGDQSKPAQPAAKDPLKPAQQAPEKNSVDKPVENHAPVKEKNSDVVGSDSSESDDESEEDFGTTEIDHAASGDQKKLEQVVNVMKGNEPAMMVKGHKKTKERSKSIADLVDKAKDAKENGGPIDDPNEGLAQPVLPRTLSADTFTKAKELHEERSANPLDGNKTELPSTSENKEVEKNKSQEQPSKISLAEDQKDKPKGASIARPDQPAASKKSAEKRVGNPAKKSDAQGQTDQKTKNPNRSVKIPAVVKGGAVVVLVGGAIAGLIAAGVKLYERFGHKATSEVGSAKEMPLV